MENSSQNIVARPSFSIKRATFMVALFLCIALSACDSGNSKQVVKEDGYVSSFDLRHRFNLIVTPDLGSGIFHFSGEANLSIVLGSNKILLNGREEVLPTSVIMKNGELFLPKAIIPLLEKDDTVYAIPSYVEKTFTYVPPSFVPVTRTLRTKTPEKKISHIVMLDPGHGGSEPGAIGPTTGITEATLNLAVSKKVRDILTAKGFKVIMTRTGNESLSLDRRVMLAQQHGAEIFVSIHHNASSDRSVKGFETFFSKNNPHGSIRLEKSKLLASLICKNFEGKWTTKNRGAKHKSLYVTRQSRMPSVLVEVEFMTNKDLEKLLRGDWFQSRAASAIAQGILDYFSK